MKYFCTNSERTGTYYHEFYKGTFDKASFWQDDSIYLDDWYHGELGMQELIHSVIPEYDPTGETEVSKEQWDMICEKAAERGGKLYEAISEAKPWAEETFKTHKCFTMIGM